MSKNKHKHKKETTMRYWEITTLDQDLETMDGDPIDLNIETFVQQNPNYYIDYGQGGSPENDYPNLCETTDSEEEIEADFSTDGLLGSFLIAGTHPPTRPK